MNFAPKYLVNDVLKAKCEAPIRVEIIDRATGVPLGEDIPDVQLEVSNTISQGYSCALLCPRILVKSLLLYTLQALHFVCQSVMKSS